MFFIARFLLTWLFWLVLADKKRWRELFLVSIFASFLGCITDCLLHYYCLWSYHHPDNALPYFLDDLDLYLVVPYLFIQWLPAKKNVRNLIAYWFIWTGVAITIEYIHISTDHMRYHQWWNIGISYLADWFLFSLFYLFHKTFKLHLLSQKDTN